MESEKFKHGIGHIIDCDADPVVPDSWSVEEHRKGGLLDVAKTKITLFLTQRQKKGFVVGNFLRKDLADKPVLNANVLDYLLAHPELIPNEWKDKLVWFWGTIYRYRDGSLCVRCLYWVGDGWSWNVIGLDHDWCSDDPALVRAS